MPQVGPDDDADPRKGPIQDRGCTDILFLILFVVFWIGMVIVAQQAFADGDPNRLIAPFDYEGRRCGYASGLEGFDNVYFPSPDREDYFFCAETCPGDGSDRSDYFEGMSIGSQMANIKFPGGNETGRCSESEMICEPGYTFDSARDNFVIDGLDGTFDDEARCFCPYKTEPLLKRCAPPLGDIEDVTSNANLTQLVSFINADLGDTSVASEIFSDFTTVWWVFPAAVGIAVVAGFVWLILLRLFAGFMVWITIFAVLLSLVLLGYYLNTNAASIADSVDESGDGTEIVGGGADTNADIMLYLSYAVFIIAAILLLIVIFMRKRIQIAVGIIKEASRAMAAMPLIIAFPIVIFLMLVAFLAYWIVVAIFLASIEPDPEGKTDEEVAKESEDLQYLQFYHVFGFYWTLNFIIAIGQTTIAGAIASWYWAPAPKGKNMPLAPIMSSFVRTLRYHLGSMAFGSLILAIVQFIRFVLRYLERKLKGKDNPVLKLMFCCLQCCFACVERFVKFLNKNAYIMVAVYGYNFCKAAKSAFNLILQNILRVAAVNLVSDFLLFLGKLFIAALTAFVCMTLMENQEDLYYWSIPTILCFFIAYIVASDFMAVFQMSIDTILLCFCEDCKRNDGSSEKPYSMSDDLRQYIDSNEESES